MSNRLIRAGSRGLAAAASVAVVAASLVGAPVAAQDAPDPSTCAGKNVAFASVQPRGDQSVVDGTYDGLERTKAELGVANTTFVEALDPATYEAILTNLAGAGNHVVMANFFGMVEPMKAVAPQFQIGRAHV